MTDDRNDAAGPPPEPPAPPPGPAPPPPVAAAPKRPKPWGWIVAALLALVLIVLVILYYMGMFDRERRAEVPWNSGYEAPAPAPAPAGQVTAQWLEGGWGQDCPASPDPQLTFQPGGRFLLGTGAGSWTLSGNIITLRLDGRTNTSSMTWDYLSPDSARVTRNRTGDVYTVYRCP